MFKDILEKKDFNNMDFEFAVNKIGLDKIKTKDLDKLVEHFGIGVFDYVRFNSVYELVSTRENNKIMKSWTISIGIMTLVMAIFTVLLFLMNYQQTGW